MVDGHGQNCTASDIYNHQKHCEVGTVPPHDMGQKNTSLQHPHAHGAINVMQTWVGGQFADCKVCRCFGGERQDLADGAAFHALHHHGRAPHDGDDACLPHHDHDACLPHHDHDACLPHHDHGACGASLESHHLRLHQGVAGPPAPGPLQSGPPPLLLGHLPGPAGPAAPAATLRSPNLHATPSVECPAIGDHATTDHVLTHHLGVTYALLLILLRRN